MMKHTKSLNANEILELIFVYLTEITSLREHDDIIIVLANMGRALTSADRCTVWIVNDDKKTIWTKVAHGMDAVELPMDSGIVGHSITTGEKIIIDDVYQDERFNSEIDKKTGYTTKSMMVIPMSDSRGKIIGAFQVINHKGESDIFEKRDMKRLMLASTYAAESIVSATLAQEIEDTQKEVVFTMGAIGESRSKETGNHVKRVAEYSKILALAYGLSEEKAELLKQASPMHDIGKIAIPDAILNKPGKFTNSEFEIMKRHAELGHSMIKNSDRPLLQAASIVAYEHHERWDGKGYPQGLKAETIHIYGRITAIADVFDALGSDRVYKKAWNDMEIFNLFKEEKGKQFDPELVDIFFENLNKIIEVREEFKDNYIEDENQKKSSKNSIKILGAHGTKAKGHGTSAFELNETNVIDAGNLLNPLEEKSANIENIWLTHSHLDHISDIAYILDNYFDIREKTLNIIGLPETIQAIKKHFFNDLIWPDFSKIALQNSDKMVVEYVELELGVENIIGKGESIEAFKTDHTVPSCGYIYKKNKRAVIITADTCSLATLIDKVNNDKEIKSMVLECSFSSDMEKLAKKSKHLTPKLLFKELKKLKRDDINLYINHLKPNYLEKIKEEISQYRGDWKPIILNDSDIINF
ncbi:HD domain-containing phosphohydrolase [Sulfurimonas sp.]|uniref:HD domain-containing phosphohydrolase n=1 Tax=Sulfurimonas sp. TaxID=2022749 RepID=UPI00260DF53F|nr:HD domain-containing phosphohydrolase [Sulfurimonas sp.]MCW8894734.1 HD domain-containing protein [Sulfurimonas sp.]MCW9067553.1 HD domain-containing protein [Sulfurimonas sp.]